MSALGEGIVWRDMSGPLSVVGEGNMGALPKAHRKGCPPKLARSAAASRGWAGEVLGLGFVVVVLRPTVK